MSPQNEAKLLDLLGAIERGLRDLADGGAQHARFEATISQHGERLARMEEDIAAADETYVEDLRKRITAQEGTAQHWVRYVVGVVVSILIVVFSAGMGYLLKK